MRFWLAAFSLPLSNAASRHCGIGGTAGCEAEIFFKNGSAIGLEGLEVTFTSHILDSYQNTLTNH